MEVIIVLLGIIHSLYCSFKTTSDYDMIAKREMVGTGT